MIVEGGGGSEGGKMDELGIGTVVIVCCESGKGRKSGSGLSEGLTDLAGFFCLAFGLDFSFRGRSSSDEVISITSGSTTSAGFRLVFLTFSFELELLLEAPPLPLALGGVGVDLTADE